MENPTINQAPIKVQYAANIKQVLWLTGMTECDLLAFINETGVAWIRWYTGADRATCQRLMNDPVIKGWWKNEWCIRDDEFYLNRLYHTERLARMSMYRALHQNAFVRYVPAFNKLAKGYTEAIGLMNKRIQKSNHAKTHRPRN